MTSPLLAFQSDFDPRAFAFQDLAAERKDKCLNIGKCDGSRSGLPKEGLQGLLMTFLHKYMMAECASISHVCRCGAAVASASYPFPPPDRLPPSYAGVGAAGDGGMLFSGLWWLVDDRLATECGQSDDAFLEARPLVGSEPCCPPAPFGRSVPTARQGFYPWTPATAGHCSRRSHLAVGGQKRGGIVRRSAWMSSRR